MDIGVIILVVVAMAYGIGFAVLPTQRWTEQQRRTYTLGGALLIAVLAVVIFAIPW